MIKTRHTFTLVTSEDGTPDHIVSKKYVYFIGIKVYELTVESNYPTDINNILDGKYIKKKFGFVQE